MRALAHHTDQPRATPAPRPARGRPAARIRSRAPLEYVVLDGYSRAPRGGAASGEDRPAPVVGPLARRV